MAKIDKVQEVSLGKLHPYPNNAKKHSADQVQKIADSISEFGFISPCLIDKDFNIIVGDSIAPFNDGYDYFDDIETDGADPVAPLIRSGLPKVLHHSVRVELYEYAADDEAETKLEAEFDAAGVAWTKEDRHWLADSAWYQVIYEIEYITK